MPSINLPRAGQKARGKRGPTNDNIIFLKKGEVFLRYNNCVNQGPSVILF